MSYIIGALASLCGVLIYYVYRAAREAKQKDADRIKMQQHLNERESAIVKAYDKKIDNLEAKEFKTNEEILEYLNSPSHLPRR